MNSISTAQAGIGTGRVSTPLLNISAKQMRTGGCENLCRTGRASCKFLLGYTVQRADWDGRYSAAAKREAAKFDYRITDPDQRDPFSVFHTNAHPCLVNYTFELLMEQERTKQKPAHQRDQPER